MPQGAYIVELVTDSPADKAGVKENDIIVKIGGQQLDEDNGLTEVIAKKKVGDEVSLEIYRDGEELKLKVKLEEAGE